MIRKMEIKLTELYPIYPTLYLLFFRSRRKSKLSLEGNHKQNNVVFNPKSDQTKKVLTKKIGTIFGLAYQ